MIECGSRTLFRPNDANSPFRPGRDVPHISKSLSKSLKKPSRDKIRVENNIPTE
jgi:hypothetical protein